MKIHARFTTAVSFWVKNTTYTPGEGNTTTWTLFTEGSMSVFPCEWTSRFGYGRRGNEVYAADAEGVVDRASVRMPYIPALYDKLRTETVIVIKGTASDALIDGEPNPASPDVYENYGGIDCIHEERQYIEFLVHRYEVQG